MDLDAMAKCRDHDIDIVVININNEDGLMDVISGKKTEDEVLAEFDETISILTNKPSE